jgi:hypothetical protein
MYATAFIEGLIWSVLWIIYVYVIVTKYPWQMLHDYPEDIQKASTLPEPTKGQNRQAKLFGLLGSLVLFGTLIAFGLIQFHDVLVSFQRVRLFRYSGVEVKVLI